MSRFISTKRLSPTEAVSVLALRSKGVADDAQLMPLVSRMVLAGARPTTITRLTGMPFEAVRRMWKRERGYLPVGLIPTSVLTLTRTRQQRLECAILVHFFEQIYAHERALDMRTLVESYSLYTDAVGPQAKVPIDGALSVLESYVKGHVWLCPCSACCVSVLCGLAALRQSPVRDACPTCATRMPSVRPPPPAN